MKERLVNIVASDWSSNMFLVATLKDPCLKMGGIPEEKQEAAEAALRTVFDCYVRRSGLTPVGDETIANVATVKKPFSVRAGLVQHWQVVVLPKTKLTPIYEYSRFKTVEYWISGK